MCLANRPKPHPAGEATGATFPHSTGTGSRRYRLWDLPAKCHCPVIGACLPVDALRRIVGRAAGGQVLADDYELHVGSVHECARRSPLSEQLQQALERRHAQAISRFRQARSGEMLFALWVEAVRAGEVAGALWAALTHPRCDEALRDKLCCDMHMLQHQAAAGARADLNRMQALEAQNASLGCQLKETRQRSGRLLAERDKQNQQLSAQLMQLRAAMLGKDTMVAALQSQCAALRSSVRGLDSRERLQQKMERLLARLAAADDEIAALRRQRDGARPQLPAAPPEPAPEQAPEALDLRDRTVLCVGGRSGSVATYRDLVESVGGRFAHHDGGRENNARQLDATLAAADLVICQTGCISHHAYWRVKDHCKRHNKRCVFLDNPSISSLARGLGTTSTPAPCIEDLQEP